jgi:hypothetical protein
LAEHIAALWADPGIQTTYTKRSNYQLNDSALYFLDKVLEIAKSDYLPSEDDILRSRVRTTGNSLSFFSHRFNSKRSRSLPPFL